MKGNELLDKMGLVDPAFIKDADSAPKVKKLRSYIKWVALVACICLLGMPVLAVGTGSAGTWLADLITLHTRDGFDYEQSGYDLGIGIEKIPEKALSVELRNVGKIIRYQYKHDDPFSSRSPSYWSAPFDSRDAACDFVGYKNLKRIDWGPEETETKVTVYGNSDGKLEQISIQTSYASGDILIQFWSEISTEHDTGVPSIGARTTENIEFTEGFYTAASGITCHIMHGSEMESGRKTMTGYIVLDDVLYSLHISYPKINGTEAGELLYRWADSF